MSQYIVALNKTEAEQIARQARARGYGSPADYLRALVAADALLAALGEDWQDAEESAAVLEAELREAWHDAMIGNTLPIEHLWDELEDCE